MHITQLLICLILFISTLIQTSNATVNLRVFSKDEGLTETNISKPRFYIQNTGNESLSDFYCYYYFTSENGKKPVVEDYYTPDASISLETLDTNGSYRVKFSFTGITIKPGNVLPNPDGEIIGLHYSDWSAWNKSNDFSNTGLSNFTLNGNITVFSSSNTLIYGNKPSDPSNPPQPPLVLTGIDEYVVLSSEYTDIRDRVIIKGGDVGSGVYTEIGADAIVNGNVFSGGSMFLRSNDSIRGNATARENVNKQNGVVVTGTTLSHSQIEIPQITNATIIAGTTDITVPNDSVRSLLPGIYKDFHAYSRATIILHSGNYVFNSFIIEPDVQIKLDNADNGRINLNIVSELRFADRTNMTFENGIVCPYSVKICSNQTTNLSIGTDCTIYGNIISPNAEVHIYSRTDFYGALYGRKVVAEPDVVICKPPVMQDLWHSEWAFYPPFDPSVLDYTAIIPDTVSTLTVSAAAAGNTVVTVNGQNSSDTINLSETETDVKMVIEKPGQCGATVYNLKVIRSGSYQIFVNDDSPCSPGNEDGRSWETAFKNLQQAIDTATKNGKEIWLAEGIYKPTHRTLVSDSRSATFMIYPGIEIIGGFKGTETKNAPEGSTYNTILTGDLLGNDSSIVSWPPEGDAMTFITDNAYHVVTVTGSEKASAIHLKGFITENGIANGTGSASNGGGIYIKDCIPTFELLGIHRNLSGSSGGGVYVNSNVRKFTNCLFRNNYSLSGNGAGLFVDKDIQMTIEGSIFDGNMTLDTLASHGGSALYIEYAKTDIVNSVFTRNNSSSVNGTLFNNSGELTIVNCTFANNISESTVSIHNGDRGSTSIVNSILWNSENLSELSGSNISVNYSCITGGYVGTGNISGDPAFVNIDHPEGIDNIYGTEDDGLQLSDNSPAIGVSKDSFPETDITKAYRIVKPDGCSDLGAYAYIPPSISFEDADAVFGYFDKNDDFKIPEKIKAFEPFDSEWGYILAKKSNRVLHARLLVDNRDETRKINDGPVTIYARDSLENTIYEKKINMVKAPGEIIRGKLVFYSQYPILFLQDSTVVSYYENTRNDNLYFFYGNASNVKKFEIVAYTKDYR